MNVRPLGAVLLLALLAGSADAALHSRLGGQAYYDDVLDVTWLANANAAAGSAFDDGFSTTDGRLSWSAAQSWVAALNAANHLGANNWRLPATAQPDASCAGQYDPGSPFPVQGYSIGCTGSEMGHLFNVNGVQGATPAPFANVQVDQYWSGTTVAFSTGSAWSFDFGSGSQNTSNKVSFFYYAWAVRSGDLQPAPDTDADGVADATDNCTLVANASQCDSDGDGYGNRCDGDLNNNGSTNAQDTTLFRQQLGQPSTGPTFNKADINCNGAVNAQDTTLFRSLLGSPPGPSGLVP